MDFPMLKFPLTSVLILAGLAMPSHAAMIKHVIGDGITVNQDTSDDNQRYLIEMPEGQLSGSDLGSSGLSFTVTNLDGTHYILGTGYSPEVCAMLYAKMNARHAAGEFSDLGSFACEPSR